MGTVERALARAARAADRQARDLGDELRESRLALGLSQATVAAAARVARNRYGRIENAHCSNLALTELGRIAVVLGLSTSIRLYPARGLIRDAGHSRRLLAFLGWVRPPASHRTEVPLPIVEGRAERRAWDAVIFGGSQRCAVELEMRVRDVQATLRRIDLKRRDDPTEAFLLLLADTRRNRLVVAEFNGLFSDLPRLRPTDVRAALDAGLLPDTGLLFM